MTPPAIRTAFLMTVDLNVPIAELIDMGDTPAGRRRVGVMAHGRFEGPRLRGRVVGGHNWILVRPDGVSRFDLRVVLEADDGALIGMTYQGLRHGPAAAIERMMQGEPVAEDALYMRAAPFFETAAPAYAWLNTIVTIATGERRREGSRYHVHQVL